MKVKYISNSRVVKEDLRCVECGSNKRLQIHHIDKDHFNNAPENKECLCILCHADKHPMNGYKMVSLVLKTYGNRNKSMRKHIKTVGKIKRYSDELDRKYHELCGPVITYNIKDIVS